MSLANYFPSKSQFVPSTDTLSASNVKSIEKEDNGIIRVDFNPASNENEVKQAVANDKRTDDDVGRSTFSAVSQPQSSPCRHFYIGDPNFDVSRTLQICTYSNA